MKSVMTTAATVACCLGGALATPSALAIPEGPEPGTAEWTEREMQNFARTLEAPLEQVASPEFQLIWQLRGLERFLDWLQRGADDLSWLNPLAGNTLITPLASTHATVATGDPTRFPDVDGPNGRPFYEEEGERIPITYYDSDCARIAGHVWAPRDWEPGDATLPNVVIQNGSIQAPETLYWWAAQALVRAGYVVMTFDPRGQGRSDMWTPDFEQGGNINSEVFFEGMVNAIDFFRSTPEQPYPHNATCADAYPTPTTPHNPFWERIDRDRLGITGHSLGASGISSVQGYPGERFAFPDAGGGNPVRALVAWDRLSADADNPPRVPAMGQSADYPFLPVPYNEPPAPEAHKGAYHAYREAGVPVFQFTVQGATHFDWSLLPAFPATSWCPDVSNRACDGGWGQPMIRHYTVAWMDRWLKLPDEPGYDDADARLLADADWCQRLSFYHRSARDFPTRGGERIHNEDLRADCLAGRSAPTQALSGSDGGGAMTLSWLGLGLALLLRLRARPARCHTAATGRS